ncbi:MAG: hypothetical protein GX230_01380 [Lentisphaerae bacterium]|jgi:hypothetical protein|nr:hypothetical protein [Lentisphaerota bacterium]
MAISKKLYELIRKQTPGGDGAGSEPALKEGLLQSDQREQLEHDMQILDDDWLSESDIRKEASQQLREAAESSLRRLQVIQHGRCPQCGEGLRQHLFASVCDACGWYVYDTPRNSGVRVHLAGGGGVVEGDRAYVVKSGAVLVLRGDAVAARVPPSAFSWIEYLWNDEELSQRNKEVLDRLTIICGWCSKIADPEADGFHICQVAFGSTQERYCFCSDECFEAFRKMYPSRVHRNCYERSCVGCDLCTKRYDDESEGIRTLAKDYIKERRK